MCQFFVLAGNRFWFYILLMYLEYHTVVVLCQFFGSGGKLFLVLLMYLVYNTVVRLCQFCCCGRKANLVQIFLLNPNFFSYIGIKFLLLCIPFLLCMDLQLYSHDRF